MIDLRSDTVTKPSAAMLQAMMQASVGDDVLNEDPTVQQLQKKTAAIFGMEAGLFCPSGTMTNQIAIRLHTQPQQEVICDKRSHIYLYEGGGIAYNSMCSVRLLDGKRGILSATDVEASINNPDDIHAPQTALVSLENTVNKGGGAYYTLPQITAIREVCHTHHLPLHLDGARVFNALTASGDDAQQYGTYFDTISVCLSKGLGAPVGSVLLGSKAHIQKAMRIRKVLGGGMRQVGYLAAAGIYALDNNIRLLADDHQRARVLGDTLQALPFVSEVLPVDTNIVIFSLKGMSTQQCLAKLAAHNILAIAFGPTEIRMVTHLDFDDAMLDRVTNTLRNFA